MRVQVLFFAQLREVFGTQEKVVDLEPGATVARLRTLLMEDARWRELSALPLRYAVNERFASVDQKLDDHDVVAVIPPVAGG